MSFEVVAVQARDGVVPARIEGVAADRVTPVHLESVLEAVGLEISQMHSFSW